MRIFKPRMGFLLLPALPLLVCTPASLAQDEKWEIDGNANLGANSFLGSILGENDFVLFKTNGVDRMKIFATDTTGGQYSDLDGVFQIFTNLHLKPDALYNGDLIMPWGRWIGTDFAPGGNAGSDAGNLMMTKGDLAVMLGEFAVTNEDGLMLFTVSDGAADTRLVLDFADLWVKDGNAFLGPKPGNPPGGLNKNNLLVSSGQVFIGDEESLGGGPNNTGLGPVTPSNDEPVLRIDGYGDFGFGTDANDHVVFIRSYDPNPASTARTADGLAIQLDGLTANAGVTSSKNNFITFYDTAGEARGAVEGFIDPLGIDRHGVTYKSGGADFAEYLEKMDPAEVFSPGEIVGVFAGKVSKVIDGADHILVITGAPVVLGNAPNANMENLYAKVAFLGQVPVLVLGEANPGDYILPSGLNDGTGVAVSPEDLPFEEMPAIVGTAWSTANGGYVNLALGFKAINWGQVIETVTKPAQLEMIELTERVRQMELFLQGITGRQPAPGGNSPNNQ